MIKRLDDLEVYTLSIEFAMEIFVIYRRFPSIEKYSLTDPVLNMINLFIKARHPEVKFLAIAMPNGTSSSRIGNE